MPQPKKMQVFVSSTYTDLKQERQAAVEAILTAGHIPAGMELFAAGDESQMDVIRRWINESDVFLLILGGRYGTLDPQTNKSYVHLEFEHAVSTGIALFAVVIDESHLEARVRAIGSSVIETENAAALRKFRELLVSSRIVKFWGDTKDIKLAILETLPEFARRSNIEGWVRASTAVDVAPLAEEVARLSKENGSLREQLAISASTRTTYNGLTFEELYEVLANAPIPKGLEQYEKRISDIAEIFGDANTGLLHALWLLSGRITKGLSFLPSELATAQKLDEFGLIFRPQSFSDRLYQLTSSGQQFLLRLRQSRDVTLAEQLRAV